MSLYNKEIPQPFNRNVGTSEKKGIPDIEACSSSSDDTAHSEGSTSQSSGLATMLMLMIALDVI